MFSPDTYKTVKQTAAEFQQGGHFKCKIAPQKVLCPVFSHHPLHLSGQGHKKLGLAGSGKIIPPVSADTMLDNTTQLFGAICKQQQSLQLLIWWFKIR